MRGAGSPEYEMVLEIGHRFQVTPSTYIQPDIQYIVQPGGTGDIDERAGARVPIRREFLSQYSRVGGMHRTMVRYLGGGPSGSRSW